ncbi:MAG: VCBS repeat-containing protein [Steroidobacteraceae bacterium]
MSISVKKIMRVLCAGGLLAVGALNANAAASSLAAAAGAIAWTPANSHRLYEIFHNNQTVAEFVNETLPTEDQGLEPLSVGEYRIIDLNNDGHLQLVCTVDVTGRAFYTGLVVFSQQNGRIVRSDTSTGNGANLNDLGSSIVDINHDGRKEILVPRLLGPYSGSRPVGRVVDVFKVRNGQMVKANQEFSGYYRDTLLPQLKSKLDSLIQHPERSSNAETARQEKMSVVQKEIDAVEKLAAR